MATAMKVYGDGMPHILMGDSNKVQWEKHAGRLEHVGAFLDPRSGRRIYLIWNATKMLLKWRRDPMMLGPG